MDKNPLPCLRALDRLALMKVDMGCPQQDEGNTRSPAIRVY